MSRFTDTFLLTNAKYLPADKIPYIRERLNDFPEENQVFLSAIDFQDPMVMLLISWIGGSLGIDRFMLGDVTLGVLKLVTLGGCGIWTIIDLFLIMNATREANFTKLTQVL